MKKNVLKVQTPKGCKISFGITIIYENEAITRSFYTNTDIQLNVEAYKGCKVKGWMVEDDFIDAKNITIDWEKYGGDMIVVQPVVECLEDMGIYIAEISA